MHDDDDYTKKELKIHKDGARALVRAVVEQWLDDGRPRGDDIDIWINLLLAIEQEHAK